MNKTCSHVVHSMYWFDDWKGCCSHNKGVVFTLYMLLVACCLVWLSLFWSQLYCYVNNLFIAPANDRMEPLVSTQLWKHTFYHFKTTWKLSRWKTNFPKLLFFHATWTFQNTLLAIYHFCTRKTHNGIQKI